MKRVVLALVTLLAVVGAAAALLLYKAREELLSKQPVNAKVEVKEGETLKEAINDLLKAGLKVNPKLLYAYARYEKLKLKAGCYDLQGRLSPAEALRELTTGKPCLKSFTIPPGSDLFELDRLLSQEGICRRGQLLKLSRDKAFLRELGVPTLEGYLFPDTYFVNRNADCKKAIEVAVEEFKRQVLPLYRNYKPPQQVKEALKKVTLNELITVASIVEKETSLREERPLIASVIYNRLKRGMKVQCDPTVIYALKLKGEFKRKLTYQDLKTPSPYNTYYAEGLPPAPICNPSLSSLKAAMYPAKTDYLYFVATGKGGHAFSKSYNEHLRKVKALRRHGEKSSS